MLPSTPQKLSLNHGRVGSFSPKFKKKNTPANSNQPDKSQIGSFSHKFKTKTTPTNNNITSTNFTIKNNQQVRVGSFSPQFSKATGLQSSSNNYYSNNNNSVTSNTQIPQEGNYNQATSSTKTANTFYGISSNEPKTYRVTSYSPKFKKKTSPFPSSCTLTNSGSRANPVSNNTFTSPSAANAVRKNIFPSASSQVTSTEMSRAERNRLQALQKIKARQMVRTPDRSTHTLNNSNIISNSSTAQNIPTTPTKQLSQKTHVGSFSPKFKQKMNNSNMVNLSPSQENPKTPTKYVQRNTNVGSFSPKFKQKNKNGSHSFASNPNNQISSFANLPLEVLPHQHQRMDWCNEYKSTSVNDTSSDQDLLLFSLTQDDKSNIERKRLQALEKLKTKQMKPVSYFDMTQTSSPIATSNNKPLVNYSEISVTLSMKNFIWFQVAHEKKYVSDIKSVALNIASRNYNARDGFWLFHVNDYKKVVQNFQENLSGIKIEVIPSNIVSMFQNFNNKKHRAIDLSSIEPTLLEKLMPFQREGVIFGIEHNGRVLIADDMGLGKTIEAIGLASYYKDDWPVLIICPSSMKTSWLQHFLSWIPTLSEDDISIIHNSKNGPGNEKVTIVSYDLATKLVVEIKQKRFNIIIADESHFLKNHQAARTKTLVPLLQQAKRAILLSGTPALSRPKELFMQLKALQRSMFTNYKEFSIRYCDGKEGRYGWDDSGSSNTDELNHVLKATIMIRRLKEDVLQQLPEKRRQIVVLDAVKQTKELKKTKESFIGSSKKEKRSSLMHYYDSTCDAKMKGVCEYISEQLESEKKIIVFAHHLKMLDVIQEMARKKKVGHIRIDGKTNSKNRQSLVDEFTRNPHCLLAILSITAAGTGLNITASSYVVFAELYWNPGHLVQAEDRSYRYGQKNAVVINYLVAKQTADDYIWSMVAEKLKVLGDLGVGMTKELSGKTSTFKDPNQRLIQEFFEELNQMEDAEFQLEDDPGPSTKRLRVI